MKGYIIVSPGQRMSTAETKARAQRAKDYLVKTRPEAAARVVTLDGARREKFAVALYMMPDYFSPQKASPAPKKR